LLALRGPRRIESSLGSAAFAQVDATRSCGTLSARENQNLLSS
jgi:hypothetical protein